jgi:S1-C subfamily serine protease
VVLDYLFKNSGKTRIGVAVFLLTANSWAAGAEDTDRSLLAYAVGINQAANSRSGTGIYFGNGFVLTASHVVGRALFRSPNVTIAGRDLPARIVKQDTVEQSDLALLAVDEKQLPDALRSSRLSLCKAAPWPGEEVITVIPEEAVHSSVLSPVWLPANTRQYNTVISDVARTGNSGSGVFDAKDKCLLGIMSRKISEVLDQAGERKAFDIAKYFVPVSAIEEFLPKGVIEVQP